MGYLRLLSLALLGLQATSILADNPVVDNEDSSVVVEEVEELPDTIDKTPQLKLTAKGSISHSDIFGIKIVNNVPTNAVLTFDNAEPQPVTVAFVAGTLADPRTGTVVRNLTKKAFKKEVPAGGSADLTYSFTVEMNPQDLNLTISAVVTAGQKKLYTVPVLRETVAVVEKPISFLDPQTIFLYLVLASLFGGTCYAIYSTWIVPLLPQQKRTRDGGKSKRRAETSAAGETSAFSTGAKGYDESWIPAQHLNRPEAKRVKSGAPKTKPRS